MTRKSNLWVAREMLKRPLVPKYAQPGDLGGAVAVIAVPFNCYLRGEDPDLSNEAIARAATTHMEGTGLPFYGQWEHTNLLRDRGLAVREFKSSDGERVQSQWLVGWQAHEILALGQGNKVILVGVPDHLGRCKILAEYFGLNPVIPQDCAHIPYDPRNRPGAQDWCKTREQFVRYEWPKARVACAILGLLGLLKARL